MVDDKTDFTKAAEKFLKENPDIPEAALTECQLPLEQTIRMQVGT